MMAEPDTKPKPDIQPTAPPELPPGDNAPEIPSDAPLEVPPEVVPAQPPEVVPELPPDVTPPELASSRGLLSALRRCIDYFIAPRSVRS